MRGLSEVFWSETIWLPPNVTWNDFEQEEGYAKFGDLVYSFPIGLFLVLARTFVEGKVFRPLGQWLGVGAGQGGQQKEDRQQSPQTKLLEEEWISCGGNIKTLGLSRVKGLERELGMTERQIERWFRKRCQASRPSPLDKFSETGWRWLFYLSVHIWGLATLWDMPWMWNTGHCWYKYPFHKIDNSVWWYYMVETGFYWSLLFTQFVDVKRKDFWEMFLHHITTLALLVLSWTNHMHRMGALVLLFHDFVDHWVELAKLAIYAKIKIVGDVCFVIFSVTWAYSRLGIFPSWVIYSTTVEAANFVEMFPVYYIFNCLFSILLILHVVWFGFIIRMIFKVLADGPVADNRSESDSDGEAESSESSDD